MYETKLQKYLTEVINDGLGTDHASYDLDYEVLVHLLPLWTGSTSRYARSVAITNPDALTKLSLEQRYPEMTRVSHADKEYAMTRYETELVALYNFITYYSQHPIPSDRDFHHLFDEFVTNTTDAPLHYPGESGWFEEGGIIYVMPLDDILNMVASQPHINPHTGRSLHATTLERLSSHYRVEIQMLI